MVVGLSCRSTPFLWCLPKETVSSRQRKALFYPGGSTIRVSASASVIFTHLRPTLGRGGCVCAVSLGRSLFPLLPVPPHFFSLAQRNGVEPQRNALMGAATGGVGSRPPLPRTRSPNITADCVKLTLPGRLTNRPQTNLTHQFVPLGLTPNGRGGRAHQGDVEASKRFSLAARHRFFGQAPKKWGRMAGQANDPSQRNGAHAQTQRKSGNPKPGFPLTFSLYAQPRLASE